MSVAPQLRTFVPDARGLAVTVVGCGNAGHALAGEMAAGGASVRMLEPMGKSEALTNLAASRRIVLTGDGAPEGEFPIEAAASDAEAMLSGADIVLVAVPAFAHREVARKTAHLIPEGALVVLFTGGLGSQEWHNAVRQAGATLRYPVVETSTLPYAVRLAGPSRARIILRLKYFSAAVFPGRLRHEVEHRFLRLFPQARLAASIVEPCLRNVNGIIHPPVMLANISRVEDPDGAGWKVWQQGVTPAVARIVDRVDAERLAVARAFGIELPPVGEEQHAMGYGPGGGILESLTESRSLAEIEGPTSVDHRFFTEDVPYFLSALIDLAELAGTPCPTMRAVAVLAGAIHGQDWIGNGRTLASLGLDQRRVEDLLAYLHDPETESPNRE